MSYLDTVQALIEDWKRKDLDAVANYVTDDLVYFYAAGQAPINGKEAFRAFLETIKEHQQQPAWRIKRSAESVNTLFVEGVDDYVNPAGHHIQTPYVGIYEFRDGKISAWRDYFDFELLKKMETGDAPNEHYQALVKA
ncbi:MAG: nuclear transport factor 2 family protein [Cellvibrionaceae bacterium]|nr:nuclear transport factor 2 family protein [Cellvibrionaceae bacterium]